MGSVICLLVGASGSGKTTVAEAMHDLYGLTQIESYTTRPRRTKDEIGHIFVTDAQFDQLTDFVGFTNFNGYRYAATAQQVEANDLYVIDPAGIEFFRTAYRGRKRVAVIHINVDRLERMNRMIRRGDDPEQVFKRLANDDEAFQNIDADFTVENYDDPKQCAEKIFELVFRGDVS